MILSNSINKFISSLSLVFLFIVLVYFVLPQPEILNPKTMSPKTILVLGAGPRVGTSIIKRFSQDGYKTIGVSQNPSPDLLQSADLAISADLSKHESFKSVFSEVKTKMGVPNVVVYNYTPLLPFTKET